MGSLTETLACQHGTKAKTVLGFPGIQIVERTARLEGIMQPAIGLPWGDFVCGQMTKHPQQCLAAMKAVPSPQKVRPNPGKVELLIAED